MIYTHVRIIVVVFYSPFDQPLTNVIVEPLEIQRSSHHSQEISSRHEQVSQEISSLTSTTTHLLQWPQLTSTRKESVILITTKKQDFPFNNVCLIRQDLLHYYSDDYIQ